MRKLFTATLLFALTLLLSPPASAGTWSLVQVKDASNCGNPCAVTVTSTGSGHQIAVYLINGVTATITSVSGGGTYTHPAGCAAGDATSGFVDCAYTNSSTSGTTSISISFSGSTQSDIGVVFELADTGTPVFDTNGSNNVTTNCTSCNGVTLSLTGSNDGITTVATCGGTCSAVGAGYTADLSFLNGDGYAHKLNTTTTPATWTQSPTSHITTAAIAFKDTAVANTTSPAQVY